VHNAPINVFFFWEGEGWGGGQPSGNLSLKCSTRDGILASITIPFLFAIFKNYQEIIEKSFQKRQEFDTKFSPKGGEIVLSKTEMLKFPWVCPPSILGQTIDRCISVLFLLTFVHCLLSFLLLVHQQRQALH